MLISNARLRFHEPGGQFLDSFRPVKTFGFDNLKKKMNNLIKFLFYFSRVHQLESLL